MTSTQKHQGVIPEVTLGWRLRMARETTGMGLREFAEHIGVAPDTLTSAEKDRRKVRAITINAYALATGVDREWLETGKVPVDGGGGPDGAGSNNDALRRLTEAKIRRRARGHADDVNTLRYPFSAAAA